MICWVYHVGRWLEHSEKFSFCSLKTQCWWGRTMNQKNRTCPPQCYVFEFPGIFGTCGRIRRFFICRDVILHQMRNFLKTRYSARSEYCPGARLDIGQVQNYCWLCPGFLCLDDHVHSLIFWHVISRESIRAAHTSKRKRSINCVLSVATFDLPVRKHSAGVPQSEPRQRNWHLRQPLGEIEHFLQQ